MTAKKFITLSSLCLFMAVGCSKAPAPKPAEAPPAMTPAQMQEAFTKASTPGPEQKLLASLVGDWKAKVTMWMDPTKPPEVSEGRAKNVLKYGGRFVEMTYLGTFMGQKFEGTGLWGYDNIGKQYQSTWYDSMGTQVMLANGTYDPASKKLTTTSTASCPMANGPVTIKQVFTIVNDNKHTYESFKPGPDGKEIKTMEIVYTKAGSCKLCGKGKSKKKTKK
jgi:hypothetical protein